MEQEHNIFSYQPNNKTAVFFYTAIFLLLFFLFYRDIENLSLSLLYSISIPLFHFLFSVYPNRVTLIKINKTENYIYIEHYSGFRKKTEKFSIVDVSATYKEENGAKGVFIYIFRIYIKNKRYIQIKPTTSGWKDKILKELTDDINNAS
jgi:hypothetical protein